MSMRTVIGAVGQVKVPAAGEGRGAAGGAARPDTLFLDPALLREATGWDLRPEGMCRGDVCVPVDPDIGARVVERGAVDAAGLWSALGRPVVHDRARAVWVLGEGAADRSRPIDSGIAPDFTLPDIEGRLHSLSSLRGKKVFLATWASW